MVTIACVVLMVRLVSVGLGQSAQFFGAREVTEKRSFGYALVVAAFPITIVSLVVLLLSDGIVGKLLLANDPVAQELFNILQYGIPLTFIHFVASLYVLGRRDMMRYLWMALFPLFVSVFILVWGALEKKGLQVVVFAWMAQFFFSFLMSALAFVKRDRLSSAPLLPSVVAVYRYGCKSYAVSTAAFAAGRISLVMGVWFTSSAEVGFFAIGRNFADVMLLVYGAIGPLIFSYVGSMNDPKNCHDFIGRVCRLSFFLFSIFSIGIAIIAPTGIVIIFGEQYADSYLVVWVLLPGLIFSALQRILENYLYGRSKQTAMIFVHAISIILLIGSGAFFATSFGAVGLAAASTISFIGSFVFTVIIAHRVDGLNPVGLVLPRASDFLFVMKYFRRWEGKTNGK
ncbi:MAG: hypothetical protein GXP08_11515 [Gammaproteobacteria bacterium]|nr:hypothetical protein [Gammaproteobacteria bacterium]